MVCRREREGVAALLHGVSFQRRRIEHSWFMLTPNFIVDEVETNDRHIFWITAFSLPFS